MYRWLLIALASSSLWHEILCLPVNSRSDSLSNGTIGNSSPSTSSPVSGHLESSWDAQFQTERPRPFGKKEEDDDEEATPFVKIVRRRPDCSPKLVIALVVVSTIAVVAVIFIIVMCSLREQQRQKFVEWVRKVRTKRKAGKKDDKGGKGEKGDMTMYLSQLNITGISEIRSTAVEANIADDDKTKSKKKSSATKKKSISKKKSKKGAKGKKAEEDGEDGD